MANIWFQNLPVSGNKSPPIIQTLQVFSTYKGFLSGKIVFWDVH